MLTFVGGLLIWGVTIIGLLLDHNLTVYTVSLKDKCRQVDTYYIPAGILTFSHDI